MAGLGLVVWGPSTDWKVFTSFSSITRYSECKYGLRKTEHNCTYLELEHIIHVSTPNPNNGKYSQREVITNN